MDLKMPDIKPLEETGSYGKYVVEPLERGYGVTLGNSLRRVMLSSIEGAAITFVKIEGVLHEFSLIKGLREDTTELLLNLKDLAVQVERDGAGRPDPKTITIAAKGRGRVTGADVRCPPGVWVANPECYIATISEEAASLEMEMTVEVGKGYVLPDKQEKRPAQPIGVIPVGAAFTPVRKVNYTVEATRVGFKTDYERLTLEIGTNGTMRPSVAISEAALVLDRYFRHFMEFAGSGLLAIAEGGVHGEADGQRTPDTRIEEMDFSVRTYNCLKKANILTLAELVDTTEYDLMQIRNFGKKSLLEVREKLAAMDLSLKGGTTVVADETDAADGADEE